MSERMDDQSYTYERVDDVVAVRISLASPEMIRSWSYGEVKKPETINYRTYRPEKDGLFCERIFGPERDWECFCGKYKGIKHKGVVCDRCGVKVTHSRVRRKRMGHITLAAPIVHIWFFKALPNRLGTLLDMKSTDMDRIIYFQQYVVVDPGETDLKPQQLLSEDEYRRAVERYGEGRFEAGMGAEALKKLLQRLDLKALVEELREDIQATSSQQKKRKLATRMRLAEAIVESGNKPEWMVLDVIPVIPPDLRPLVLLESGNFATSDLNDLCRRIINRNNRLKKLMELNAPEVIIRNEKRMLQQAVDALFDNGRCKRPVLGSSNRPLKSLTDMIKGKQGRFRANLLGKRVDYSARSVIVVGPELRLHQCGLPKKIALELFQPFIIRRLKELNYADTIKSARKMLERKDEEVWDILEQVIHNHPVLLNRAPTLHRVGIQAFQPVLVEGNAIKIHPLVCEGFNADFDGDTMSVHLPLSIEAQVEARTLMLATHNIFLPAHGKPVIRPTQDIVLGCCYLTTEVPGEPGEGKALTDTAEVLMALTERKLGLHAPFRLRRPKGREILGLEGPQEWPGSTFETTAGRVLVNDLLSQGMPYYNCELSRKGVSRIVADCHRLLGREATIELLDNLKNLGFHQATLAGLSFSTEDLRVPPEKKQILAQAEKEVDRIDRLYRRGVITDGERYNQVIEVWTHARELVGEAMMEELKKDRREDGKPFVNPVYLMLVSEARGSVEQIRQIAGMRGLMAKPSGRIIETPIKSNFREGLGVLEYFSSTHGARKGLADTALKTADSGYLTRKLADVAQNVVITRHDCGTLAGVTKGIMFKGEDMEVPLADAVTGRVARDNIVDLKTDEVIVRENELITEEKARRIEELGLEKIRVRSPLTCETGMGVCALCYGMDLSTGDLAEEGLAVGIIAAQSIGEPGTQLTMRTFHIGGTAARALAESEIHTSTAGTVSWAAQLRWVTNPEGEKVILSRSAEIAIVDEKERELERHAVPAGALLGIMKGDKVRKGALLVKWDPHMTPIHAEEGGLVRFEDIVEGETVRQEVDQTTGIARKVIIEHKGALHPQIIVEDKAGKILTVYPLPEKANIEVAEGEEVAPGALLAKTPRELGGTQDITAGLPRVTELFEARRPKDPAVMSEIDGNVQLGEKRRGRRTIKVEHPDSGMTREHLVPPGAHLRVHAGDWVRAGQPLVDGPLVPQDILRISGEEALQQYLLREVQSVYRSQSVTIADQHIELIIAEMMRRVRVTEPGASEFLIGEVVDKFAFKDANQRLDGQGKRPAGAQPILLGVTKAALRSDSFISAASFQETTKVLTEAALAGRRDELRGLKENVILGHLIPAGTGFQAHVRSRLLKLLPEAAVGAAAAAGEEGALVEKPPAA
jgi:DNA-directed RNA polymerase subunit beta'